MKNRKDKQLIKQIEALHNVNKEIINRISKSESREVITRHTYTLTVNPTNSSSLPKNQPLYTISKKDDTRKGSEIVESWTPVSELKKIKDFFNDNIDFTCDSFEDIKRLNDEMARVAAKYDIFDCTESALEVIESFLANMEVIQTYLGEIEGMLEDAKDHRTQMKGELEDLNDRLSKLAMSVDKNNVGEEERISKQKKREEEGAKRREIHESEKKKDIEKLSYSELLRIVKELQIQQPLTLAGNYSKDIFSWLPKKTFSLLYRGSRDGFRAANFHNLCNNKGATLTIILSTSGYLFGGYNSLSWTSCGQYLNDSNAFIFSLTNPYGRTPYRCNQSSYQNSVHDSNNYGPTWGGGHDIYVSDNCNQNQSSYTNFPSTYQDVYGNGNNSFTGSRSFQVSEIEVYQVS